MIRKSIQALLLTLFCCSTDALMAQSTGAPDGIVFQAIATDANGHPASDKNVYVKDAILSRSATGQVVYAETFTARSNKEGIFTITLGKGSRTSGATGLTNIDWSAGPFFLNLKVAIGKNDDWEGNANSRNYVDMGTTQFWSVPYALYAGKVEGLDIKLNITDTAAMLRPYYRTAKLAPALALKEDVINKSTDGRLGNSDLLYPTQKAVKTYVDAHGGGGASSPVSFGPISTSSSVNGGTISGTNIISLSPADAVNSGVVTAGTQIFGGDKSFVKDIKVNGLTVGTGNSSIPTNTVLGNSVLQYNTTGYSNTAAGYASLQYNTTGYENTASGLYTLQYNTTGAANTALGYGALSRNFEGIGNTSVGHQSLLGLQNGIGNTAIGLNSMVYATGGNNNTAIGSGTLYSDNTGDYNTALGAGALSSNLTGYNNMSSGFQSMNFNTSGYEDAAYGIGSLYNNINGNRNSASGSYSLFNNTSGNNNVAFGYYSLFKNTTGQNNTAIGNEADVATDGLTNATAIGNGAIVTASNSIQLGNNSVTSVLTSGSIYAGGILLTSDKRLKQNITPLQNSLATILKLNPVHYQKRSNLSSSDYSKTENGFIAQEIQQTLPYMVTEGKDKDHLLSVDYVSLIPLLTKAIQEQQAQISKQSEDIKALKKLVEQLMQKK